MFMKYKMSEKVDGIFFYIQKQNDIYECVVIALQFTSCAAYCQTDPDCESTKCEPLPFFGRSRHFFSDFFSEFFPFLSLDLPRISSQSQKLSSAFMNNSISLWYNAYDSNINNNNTIENDNNNDIATSTTG